MDKSSIWATMLLGILLSLTFTCPRLSATPNPAIESGQSRIERLDVSGNRRVSDTVIRSYIRSRQGKAYGKEQLESDLQELYKSNLFENIEIQEADGDVGKIVTFIVTEKPLILSVKYSGNQSFTESDILAAYKKNRVASPVADALYSTQMIKAAERILKDLMTQHGKLLGTVHTEIEPAPLGAVHVRFVLNEDGEVQR